MIPEAAGMIGIALLLLLFLIKVHVAFAMAITGFIGVCFLSGLESALILLAQDLYETFTSYPLSVIPMFILMGSFAFASGISKRVYDTAYVWVGQFRGGLTIATVIACAGFAAICGSTAATAATMGKIALPEMKKYGYDDSLATGTVAAAGTLGVMIPPSTGLIVYGILVEESIGKLFLAGVLPGILLSLFFIVVVATLCSRNPSLGPPCPATVWTEKIKALSGILEASFLFLFAIGGLFLGWFSPTQAGSIGAGGALVIGLIHGQFSFQKFFEVTKEGLETSCMVLFIIAGAIIFGHFMALSQIPFFLAEWIGGLPLPPIAILVVIMFIFFAGGFFMDSMALIVVLIPIFFPLVEKLGFDSIWFGIIIVLLGEMGVITPPVGVNVFVIKGITTDIPLTVIFRGIVPFLIALIILTIIITIFPAIATFLPNLIYS